MEILFEVILENVFKHANPDPYSYVLALYRAPFNHLRPEQLRVAFNKPARQKEVLPANILAPVRYQQVAHFDNKPYVMFMDSPVPKVFQAEPAILDIRTPCQPSQTFSFSGSEPDIGQFRWRDSCFKSVIHTYSKCERLTLQFSGRGSGNGITIRVALPALRCNWLLDAGIRENYSQPFASQNLIPVIGKPP